jgi:hypothetical protein
MVDADLLAQNKRSITAMYSLFPPARFVVTRSASAHSPLLARSALVLLRLLCLCARQGAAALVDLVPLYYEIGMQYNDSRAFT